MPDEERTGLPAPGPGGWSVSKDRLETVSVPEQFAPIFLRAQEHVASYFADAVVNPRQSTISISGERYILVRAASMSVEFFDLVTSLYSDRGAAEARRAASNLLFHIAHAIGKADAPTFHERMQWTDPVAKLSAEPDHFSFGGGAVVEVFPYANPAPHHNPK